MVFMLRLVFQVSRDWLRFRAKGYGVWDFAV